MRKKHTLLTILSFALISSAKTQTRSADSLGAVTALKELLAVCKNVDFKDPKVNDSGIFYKAAPLIVYRGDDEKRAWKDFANYNNADEKRAVDEVCADINSSVNQDADYSIEGYRTNKESEGVWHVIMVGYKKKGKQKHANFAFLKVHNRFGLGDID